MKTILVLMDTLNRHFLKIYNDKSPAITPNISSFSGECAVFDSHFIGSAPCMPARRDIFTGRLNFLERSWGGIEPFDITLPSLLRKNGVFTHMITDHTHYMEIGGENYLDQFDTWDYQRGQEMDKWVSTVRAPPEPKHYGQWKAQYDRNRTRFHSDADFPSPKTFVSACQWLEDNRNADNFFLMTEAFDPHEPFDTPKEFLDLYDDNYEGPEFNWPAYAAVTEPEEAVAHLRRCYCATLTMADKWFGKFIQKLKETGHYDDALIILTTDHGHLLGEHGFTGKNFTHPYNELAHIPLLVHFPDKSANGTRINALTQNIDLMPTILKHHGIEIPDRVKGRSLFDTENAPEAVIYGWHGQSVGVCDGRHTYFRAPCPENEPNFCYCGIPSTLWKYWGEEHADRIETGRFLKYTKYPVYKIPGNIFKMSRSMEYYSKSELYDFLNDHEQCRQITDKQIERQLCEKIVRCMEKAEAPDDQYLRLNL